MKDEYIFKYAVGEYVLAGNPLDNVGIKCNVVEQIKPFDYPTPAGKFDSTNIVLLPSTRKKIRPTRYASYLLKLLDVECYLWATEVCIKKS